MKNKQSFVSFVVTTLNQEKYIDQVLKAILSQDYPQKKIEIIVVDDNSKDKTQEKIKEFQKKYKNIYLYVKPSGTGKGPAASTNLGITKAKGEFIASVDGDAIISSNWLKKLLIEFVDKKVMVVSGMIYTANTQNLWANLAGRELEDRLLGLKQKEIDSISPCNTLYQKQIFEKVGLFNENFNYYGQDVEFCYRVREAGYRILVSKKTGCKHHWKESLWGWLKQVYGTGYGRLAALTLFPQKRAGDPVSNWRLIFQVPLTLFFLIFFTFYILFQSKILLLLSLFLILILFLIQIPMTLRIIKRTKDLRFILSPPFLLLRNLAWVWSFLVYNFNRLRRLT